VVPKKERGADEDVSPQVRGQVRRFPLLPAVDLCLKCSHLFNILDARGAISVTERVGVIARIRQLAVGVAKAWVAQQQAVSSQLSAVSQQKPAAAQKA
jgi:glycyl-tRNA synthetase alpha subunit